VIAEMTDRMGNGMAKFIESEVRGTIGPREGMYSTLLSSSELSLLFLLHGLGKTKSFPTIISISHSLI